MLSCISLSSQISLVKDATFGNGGIAKISYPSTLSETKFEKIFLNQNGSLTLTLGSEGNVHSGMMAKLTSSGALDVSYGTNGKVFLEGDSGSGIQFAQQGQKMIAVYVKDTDAATSRTMLKRFLPDGKTDTTFGINGTMTARPDLFYNQISFQQNGFYHLWGKITAYLPNGGINNGYGNAGNQNPIVNGLPQEYMELYSYFGNRNGKNFLNKYHYEIAVSNENSPHQFTTYDLMSAHLYDYAGASNGISVYPKKFVLTPANEILYLYGLDPNSGDEETRAAILSSTAQPKNFNGKTYLDFGLSNINTAITDAVSLQNHYLFAGKKEGKPVMMAYDINGVKSTVNGLEEFYENVSADQWVAMLPNGPNLFVMVRNSANHDLYVIKYKSALLNTHSTQLTETQITTPFRDQLKISTANKIKKVSIYDASGKAVKVGSTAEIQTQNLTRGIYHIQIDFHDRLSETFKSIKN